MRNLTLRTFDEFEDFYHTIKTMDEKSIFVDDKKIDKSKDLLDGVDDLYANGGVVEYIFDNDNFYLFSVVRNKKHGTKNYLQVNFRLTNFTAGTTKYSRDEVIDKIKKGELMFDRHFVLDTAKEVKGKIVMVIDDMEKDIVEVQR